MPDLHCEHTEFRLIKLSVSVLFSCLIQFAIKQLILLQENSEKQAELDRALREKRAAESELERIYQEGMIQGSKESNDYNQLTLRACNAERARDETVMKVDSLTNQLRRLEMM